LISGLAFLIPEYLVARYLGAELPVVIGSVCSMAATVLAAKYLYKGNAAEEYLLEGKNDEVKIARKDALVAWSPFILIFLLLLGTSKLITPLNELLSTVKTTVDIYTGTGGTPFTFSWLATPVLWIFLSAFIGGKIQGMSWKELLNVLKKTIIQMIKTVITIIAIMATAKLMGYSGMIASISAVFVYTGFLYPLFAPFLGSIGTFVTGSGTSASVLFGGLQAETSAALGLDQAWISASNTAGAVMAKMISPQSIAVAVAAVNLAGKENELLRGTIKYFVLFIFIVGLISFIGSRILM
jgi:lactate permease